MVLAMVLDLVDTWYSTLTGPVSLRLSYTNIYTAVKSCFFSELQKVGVEDEKRREKRKEKKKSGPSPLYSWRGFLRSLTFSFLFFQCGRQRQTRSSRSKPLHHLCVVLLSIDSVLRCSHCAFTRIISCISRLLHKAMNPQVQQYPLPKKTTYFEDFKNGACSV